MNKNLIVIILATGITVLSLIHVAMVQEIDLLEEVTCLDEQLIQQIKCDDPIITRLQRIAEKSSMCN